MSILVGGMCRICLMYLYSIFNLRLFLSILFYNFCNLVLKRQSERSMVPASHNFICHLCTRAIPKGLGTNFQIILICFTFVKCACLVLYSTCVRFDLVKSPVLTL